LGIQEKDLLKIYQKKMIAKQGIGGTMASSISPFNARNSEF
jgi:hypothetical protein